MTQKETVLSFIKTLQPGSHSKQEAWVMFNTTYPTIQRGAFNHYSKMLIESNEFSFKTETIQVNGIQIETSRELNAMEYKAETIDMSAIDMTKFVAVSTGTPMDKIMSKRNGWMPGTVYIVTGESGAGKTTVCTNIADYTVENNPDKTAGFVSCEMDRMDWTEECLDNPRLAMLPTVFMLDYLDATNYEEILLQSLTSFDLVILDSFEVVIDQLKDIKGWSSKKAETKLIDMLRKAAAESGTTILAIQQFTKGGNFVGSNKIKHLLTGMMFVKFDKDGNRYVVFTKNRRAGHMVGKPMYFTKSKETGRLIFDGFRYENEESYVEMVENDKKSLEEEANQFQLMLDKAKEKTEMFAKAADSRPANNSLNTVTTPAIAEEILD